MKSYHIKLKLVSDWCAVKLCFMQNQRHERMIPTRHAEILGSWLFNLDEMGEDGQKVQTVSDKINKA